MNKQLLLALFPLLMQTAVQGATCATSSRADHISLRHSQGPGIGYGQGYTTLEAFLSPRRCYQSLVPFVDLRGHVFNKGKLAANAGLGVRYLTR